MFVGHYGPSFAGHAAAKAAPLWAFVVAAQFLDYIWSALVLAGIEKARVVEGFTAMSALDLYYMPWTHSLAMALVWSAVFAALARLFGARGPLALVLLAATVFSHWLLDLLVHVPDLPLWPSDDAPKFGFGVWRDGTLTIAAEGGVLLAGFALYLLATKPRGLFGRLGPWILLALMATGFAVNYFGPPPATIFEAAKSALAVYTAYAFFAWLLCDLTRVPR